MKQVKKNPNMYVLIVPDLFIKVVESMLMKKVILITIVANLVMNSTEKNLLIKSIRYISMIETKFKKVGYDLG